MKKEINRIFVSNTNDIRDVILSIPSFFMVKKMYPDAELVILVRKIAYDIIRNLPYVDRIFVVEDYKKSEIEGKIAYFKADVFIALYNDAFVERLAKASGARIKIGPIKSIWKWLIYKKGIFQNRSKGLKNEAEYNLDLVRKLNKKLFKDNYQLNTKLYLSNSSKIAAETFFKEYGILGGCLVVNPFNNGISKNISDDQYASLIKEFKKKNRDVKVIITCDIEEEERGNTLMDKISEEGVYIFPNGGDLLNIAAVISKSTVYLGPSAGATQMAGALQKRVVALYPARKAFGETRWGLIGDDRVTYIVVDENNPKENYKNKNFDLYDSEDQTSIVIQLEKIFKYNV